jgi:cytoskeleton protein RodZ
MQTQPNTRPINAGRLMSETGLNNAAADATTNEERLPQPERPSADNPMGPGAQLAVQRQALGLTVEQIAEQLKLAPRQVLAIEADNYDALPGMATARGFIRAYAKVVKMDAAPLVALIAVETLAPVNPMPARREMGAPFSEVRLPSMHRRGLSASWLFGGGLAILLLLGGLLVMQNMGLVSLLPVSMKLPGAGGTTEKTTLQKVIVSNELMSGAVGAQADSLPNKYHSTVLASTPSMIGSTAAPMPKPISASTPTPSENGANSLVLHVRGDSWVEIKRKSGGSVMSRILKAGTTETVDIKEPMIIVIGNVAGVDATLRGAPLQLKSGAGNTARINIK